MKWTLALTMGFLLFASVARAQEQAQPTGTAKPKTATEIVADSDRGLIRSLVEYTQANPKAGDAEQAFLTVFNKVIEHDWYPEYEPLAKAYLAKNVEGPVRPLAKIVVSMARAKAGDYESALANFNDLMSGLEGRDQEEFAVNFADNLAGAAETAGQYSVARKVYEKLIERFGDNPALKDKVIDDVARIDRVGKSAPGIVANDYQGRPFRLDAFKGKFVLIDFWATWCPPCIAELPRMQSAYAKFNARGLEIVSISLDETPEAVFDFVKARKIPWRQIHNATCGSDVVALYGVSNIPSTFLIDPSGKIIRIELRGPELERTLEKLLPK